MYRSHALKQCSFQHSKLFSKIHTGSLDIGAIRVKEGFTSAKLSKKSISEVCFIVGPLKTSKRIGFLKKSLTFFWFFSQIIKNSILVGRGQYRDIHHRKEQALAVILSGVTSSDVNRQPRYLPGITCHSHLSYNKSAESQRNPHKVYLTNPAKYKYSKQEPRLLWPVPIG